jgi:hypothetical protein
MESILTSFMESQFYRNTKGLFYGKATLWLKKILFMKIPLLWKHKSPFYGNKKTLFMESPFYGNGKSPFMEGNMHQISSISTPFYRIPNALSE